ncbi:MAG TPA: histidine kinase [Caldithrix abyssi]|uniref:Histidine kinase n=1 Tax=Caldithrix abyssi TaxID=187145 RepID=A0A7V4U0C6_CALAY|nr:histidine kinase [Caldithrix abyssi]
MKNIRLNKKQLLFYLLFSIVYFASAQNKQMIRPNQKFDRLSIKEGLSQSTVYAILQDDKGFLWIATQDGLNRYDGYDFLVFNHVADEVHSIAHNDLRALSRDSEGNLWIGTWGSGLDFYNPRLNRFDHLKNSMLSPNSLSDNKVSCLFPADSGKMWVGTWGGGLNLLDIRTKTFQRFLSLPAEWINTGNNEIATLGYDGSGYLWVGTSGGLVLIDSTSKKIVSATNRYKIPVSLTKTGISSLLFDKANTVWVGTVGDGLFRIFLTNGHVAHYVNDRQNQESISDNHITAIYQDTNGNIWIGTENGLNLFSDKNRFIRFKYDVNNSNSLSHNRVLTITEDLSGLLFIGTDGGGISIYNPRSTAFNHYTYQKGNPLSLSNPYVWTIYEDDEGILWLGTDWGLNRLDRKNQKMTYWFHDPKNPNSISYNEVMSVWKDKYGYFWIGTWGGGLDRFDPKTGHFRHFKHIPADSGSLSDNYIRFVYEDPYPGRDVLWIGTRRGGLNRLDLRTNKIVRYQHDPVNLSSISHNSILSILSDTDGSLWVGTWGGGLDKLTFDDNGLGDQVINIAHYIHNPEDTTSISSNSVSILYKDSKGRFWVGTHGAGLNLYDAESNRFKHYSMKDGLPNNVLYGILEDDRGFLWFSTNNGLCRFNPEIKGSGAFKSYDESDGLQSNEFNNQAFFKSKSGELFFGGINGFNSFFPQQVKDNPFIPPVVITDFYVFNQKITIGEKSLLKESVTYAEEIEIPYDQSVISFDFAAMNFFRADKNQYAYRMEGLHDRWIYTSADRRVATFTSLDPGEYIFRVKASNNDGIWNEKGTQLKITILPPFWKTSWFRLLVIIATVLLIYGVYKYRVRNLEAQKRKLEYSVQQRTWELVKQKEQLEEALEKVNTLGGLLPICSSCKKIRDDKGYWQQIEFYIRDHSDADFSHSLCPECAAKLYPQIKTNNADANVIGKHSASKNRKH